MVYMLTIYTLTGIESISWIVTNDPTNSTYSLLATRDYLQLILFISNSSLSHVDRNLISFSDKISIEFDLGKEIKISINSKQI